MKRIIFLLLLTIPVIAFAQNKQSISGRVVDNSENPLPGVSVVVKGTNNGTISNVEGEYTLNNVAPDDTIVFSFLGMKKQEEPVAGRSVIDIEMESELIDMDEVVVIGYQSVRKSDLTGATSVIETEETTRTMANSITESLQGLTPGVTVRNNGNPGAGPQLEIRGVASFLDSNPLYVIDGMITGVGTFVSPKNIESIQILKDASAAAIYGSRAANGVVIITTKQGVQGEAKLNVSAKHGIARMPSTYDMMDSYEYAATVRQQYQNSGRIPPPSVVGPDGTAESFDPNYNTNWKDVMTRTGHQTDLNLTLSGGSESGKYLMSGSYYKHKGIIIGNEFERMSFRVNSSGKKGRLEFGENFIVNYIRSENPNQGNAFFDMLGMLPIIPVRADEYINETNPWGWGIGSIDAVTYFWNIPAVNFINPHNANNLKAFGNTYLKYNILGDWLSYKFNLGAEGTFRNDRTLLKEGIWRYTMGRGPTSVTESRGQFTSLLMDHTLNFNKKIGSHDINGVIGFSTQESRNRFINASKTDIQRFGDDYLDEIGSAVGEPSANGETNLHFRTRGYLGRINYNYADKYLLTFTGRYDQDSRFSEEFQNGFFPSIAGAWKINNENFFSSNIISSLKLRGSYGVLGIVTVDSWDYVPLLNFNQRYPFGPDEDIANGAYAPQLTNTNLRWEKRHMQNYGFDMGILQNKLTLSAEYYISESEDALLNQILGNYLGNLGGDPRVNAGGVRNSGIEAELTYKDIRGDFRWRVSGNITTIKNEVTSVGSQGILEDGEAIDYIQTGISRSKVGRGIGEWYLIKTDGFFQSEEEILEYVNSEGDQIQPHAKPGDVRFIDLNDDGQITAEDRDFVGSSWPKLQTGLQFNGSYKDFSLNLQFLGIFDYTIYNEVKRRIDTYHESNFRADLDPWSPENPDGVDPRLGVPLGDIALTENYRRDSDRWLENGSYFRLRNVELSYNIPLVIREKLNLDKFLIVASAQNLFTLTKYSGADPDVTGSGVHSRGEDNGNWPSDKIYSIGIQVEF